MVGVLCGVVVMWRWVSLWVCGAVEIVAIEQAAVPSLVSLVVKSMEGQIFTFHCSSTPRP